MEKKVYRVYYTYYGHFNRVLCGVFSSLQSARSYVRNYANSSHSYYCVEKVVDDVVVKSYNV